MFTLFSPAFEDGTALSARHRPAGAGAGVSPPLGWRGAPAGTHGYVLLCHDPDAPGGDRAFWLLSDLPAALTSLPEGAASVPEDVRGEPPGRRCQFDLYALDVPTLGLPPSADREAVEEAMEGHLLSRARLTGVLPPAPAPERTEAHDDRQP